MSVSILLLSCKSVQETEEIESKGEFMLLKAKYEITDNEQIKFLMTAERLSPREGEYLPNSENFRVEIFDEKNNLIFNSDFEMNYLMVIMDVEPKQIGESTQYEFIWNKKNNWKKQVPSGDYKARLSIPSVPDDYHIILPFKL
ncbi:MAG: hypothetical protein KIT33_05595 [Candidatus Kapabacteria bacterium]|nr:hypothetical protein [Ignavibacteriota bacterium]MCW5884430.1 hypothetical protein [Candidatus Kapabacteria bacterium]